MTERSLRVAVARFATSGAVPTADVIGAAGAEVRRIMARAAADGARLVQFPEGTLTYPHKRLISRSAPELDESDWSLLAWETERAELEAIAAAARELSIWTVVGAPHWRGPGERPHNSLYVFSDRGALVTRYDKQRLSMTEVTYMYAPGVGPVTFTVDGWNVGLALCLEALFPDLFVSYADDGVDLVLISSAGGGIFGQLAHSYAMVTGMAISLSIPPAEDEASPVGVCGPFGWIGASHDQSDEVVVVDVPRRTTTPFHFQARHGLYDAHIDPAHPRTLDRTSL